MTIEELHVVPLLWRNIPSEIRRRIIARLVQDEMTGGQMRTKGAYRYTLHELVQVYGVPVEREDDPPSLVAF